MSPHETMADQTMCRGPEIVANTLSHSKLQIEPAVALQAQGAGGSSIRKRQGGLGPFAIISLSYILFTTTDGGVRIIVLLHAYQQGFTALALAAIFAGYELAGMIVNLLAGMVGARWGIKATLLAGLTFQLAALAMLFGWQDHWNKTQAIIFITCSQIMNGIAKDLTKLGGKTVTKLVTPEEKQMALFKMVAWITGFKNSAKGVGYLLGAALLTVSYYGALGFMVGLLLLAYPWAWISLSWDLGRTNRKNITFASIFKVNHNIAVLSIARFFLFASRDLWFEVTLPYFLRSAASGIHWSRLLVGVFLAIWLIAYGQVQSLSPAWVLKPLRQSPPNKWAAVLWAGLLVICPTIMASVLLGDNIYGPGRDKTLQIVIITVILYLFCVIFAVNSAVHSYLVVRYAAGDKVAQTVGFYYMANAGGRLVGTLLSGILYTYVGDSIVTGFGACFVASLIFVLLSSILAIPIHDNLGGLMCGPCLSCFSNLKEEHSSIGSSEIAVSEDKSKPVSIAVGDPVAVI
ncbi:hypothetical protein WJX74_008445 [Apatococcus lobatus]|uniref:Uncharacterized protein n=1 Tax=Apatococcus lobatus TaxID=904363 RepID=A0AAW1RLU8_9CHLO